MERIGVSFAVTVVVLVAAGCGGTRTVTEVRTVTAETELQPPRDQMLYGHIASLTDKRGAYELRFDPAWFLSGETANAAAAADGAVEPGQPVPNDNYVVDEGHRLLTYRVARNARVSVLTRKGAPAGLGATSISVSQLAEILQGRSELRLFEPLASGVWITVEIDTVQAIDQQYRP